jgi:tRNA-dihydrouridine synthase B
MRASRAGRACRSRRRSCDDGGAARYNVERGAQIIDINMGCPAKKVCNAAAGSALLADEPLVARISTPWSRGRRAGHAEDPHRLRSGRTQRGAIARIAEDAGVPRSPCTGRTRACAFVGAVEYDTIARSSGGAHPVIANGDIDTPEKARPCSRHRRDAS